MLIITIHNDSTGSVDIGNYNCEVYINYTKIAKARVENHPRAQGWKPLLRKMIKNAVSTEDSNA